MVLLGRLRKLLVKGRRAEDQNSKYGKKNVETIDYSRILDT